MSVADLLPFITEWGTAAGGLYWFFLVALMTTGNIRSAILFKFLPFVFGLCTLGYLFL